MPGPPLTPGEQALDARVRNEGLHHKHDQQLVVMRASHARKRPHILNDLDKVLNYPDAVRWELKESGLVGGELEQELLAQQDYYRWKDGRLSDIVALIDGETDLRGRDRVRRTPVGTTYYIDADAGLDANDGLAIGTAWRYLDKFTEAARAAGDKAILRRGMTNRYDNGSDLLFTSDGDEGNPIIIEADYDDAWSDDVDLSATATATLTFGSKTVTFVSDISGVLVAGDWIYVTAEDSHEYAYEVDTVVTTTVTLFLPYKGAQAGSGKAMTNMGSSPVWNTVAGDLQWNFDTDHYWKVQGIHVLGTDGNGNVELDSSMGHVFKDLILEGNGAGDYGLYATDDDAYVLGLKLRFFNHFYNMRSKSGIGGYKRTELRDSLLDGNNVANGAALSVHQCSEPPTLIDCELKNHARGDLLTGSTVPYISAQYRLRNCLLSSTTPLDEHHLSLANLVRFEDYQGTPGNTRQMSGLADSEGDVNLQSETTIVRSGGNTTSIKVTPSTKMSVAWELSRLLLFEFPVYATTDSKTYTVWFRTGDIVDWTADPLATELYLELEYWDHATNNFRRIVKSAGVVDFNGTTNWQSIALTAAPAQVGMAYLRCYYAKTKESGKSNIFYCDPKVVIT